MSNNVYEIEYVEKNDMASNIGCFTFVAMPIIILVIGFNTESPLDALFYGFLILLCGAPIVGISFFMSYDNESAKIRASATVLARKQGYNSFCPKINVKNELLIDTSNELIVFKHKNKLICLPRRSIIEHIYIPKYEYKQAYPSSSDYITDGILAGLTGVGTIRLIDDTPIEQISGITIKIVFEYNRYSIKKTYDTSVKEGIKVAEYLTYGET